MVFIQGIYYPKQESAQDLQPPRGQVLRLMCNWSGHNKSTILWDCRHNDATACFDQMIEAPNNLACLQHGANPKYIKLHAQTQWELWYYLKHKYGMSKDFNTHSSNQPWYGMGQGAGDACNRWVIGLDSMADAYSVKAHGWIIPSPLPWSQIKQTMKAFIDDVNQFIGKP